MSVAPIPAESEVDDVDDGNDDVDDGNCEGEKAPTVVHALPSKRSCTIENDTLREAIVSVYFGWMNGISRWNQSMV